MHIRMSSDSNKPAIPDHAEIRYCVKIAATLYNSANKTEASSPRQLYHTEGPRYLSVSSGKIEKPDPLHNNQHRSSLDGINNISHIWQYRICFCHK